MKNNNTLWAIVGVIVIIILVVIFSKSSKEPAVDENEIGIDVPLGTGGADEETGETAGEETSVSTQTPTFPQTGFSGSE